MNNDNEYKPKQTIQTWSYCYKLWRSQENLCDRISYCGYIFHVVNNDNDHLIVECILKSRACIVAFSVSLNMKNLNTAFDSHHLSTIFQPAEDFE